MCSHPWPNFSPGKDTQKTTLTSQLPAYIVENKLIQQAQNLYSCDFQCSTGDMYD